MDAELFPILFPGFFGAGTSAGALLGSEQRGAVFDFKNDQVLVRGGGLVPNVLGTVQQAIDASALTYTRATSASRVNASGLLETVSSGVWRRQYDPLTLSPLGYLPEPARTNLALYSNDFTNAAWTKSNLTTAKTATGPDGVANSASTLTATAGDATALQAITSASAGRITSCYIKRRTGSGVVNITHDNGTTWTAVTVTSNWTLVSNPTTTAANPTVGIRIVTSGDAVDVAYFQHEVGAYVTSPIPTTSATVTRNADVMYANLTKLPFSAAVYTMIVQAQPSPDAIANGYFLVSVDDGTLNNRANFFNGAVGNKDVITQWRDGNISQAQINATAIQAAAFKIAGAGAANDFEVVANGASKGTDVSGAMPTSPTRFTIGSLSTGISQWGAPIGNGLLIPRRLTSAEMITRTV